MIGCYATLDDFSPLAIQEPRRRQLARVLRDPGRA